MVIRHRIPDDKRGDIIKVVEQIEPKLPNPSRPELEYLFEIYNEYVAAKYAPEKITCGGCRSKVIGAFRYLAREWKQQEQQNLNK